MEPENTGLTVRLYNERSNAFDQTLCVICRDEYTDTDKVTELACRHLFHEDCFNGDIYCKCPVCFSTIAGRVQVIDPVELENELLSLFSNLKQLFYEMRDSSPEDAKRMAQRFLHDGNETIRTHLINPLSFVRVLNEHIPILIREDRAQIKISLNRNAFAIARYMYQLYATEVVDLNSAVYLKELFNLNPLSVYLYFGNVGAKPVLIRYLLKLQEKVCQDERLIELFNRRLKDFRDLHQQQLMPLRAWQKYYYISNLSPLHQVALKDLPCARVAFNIQRTENMLMLAIMFSILYIIAYHGETTSSTCKKT